MRLQQLEYVTLAARCGSLRQAAETLKVSQATMSESIAKLERELGVSLLDRARSGVRVSREGAELMPQIQSIVEAVKSLRASATTTQRSDRRVRLGTVNTGGPSVLLPALRTLESAGEANSVELHYMRQPMIEEGLMAGTLDLGLVNLMESDTVHPDLETTPLLTGSPVALIPQTHRLAHAEVVTAEELHGERLIGAREGYLMHRVTQAIFGGRPPAAWHVVDSGDAAMQLVSAELGISLMPSFNVPDSARAPESNLVMRHVDGPVPRIVMTMLHKRTTRPFDSQIRLAAALHRQATRVRSKYLGAEDGAA